MKSSSSSSHSSRPSSAPASGDRRRSLPELDAFFAQLCDLACILDREARIERVNPAFARALGAPEDAFQGQLLSDLLHPDDQGVFAARIESALGDGTAHELELRTRLVTCEGAVRWIEWRARTNPDEGRAYASGRDVTDRNRLERAAEAQRVTLESIAAGAPLNETLERVTRLVEDDTPRARCTVLLVDADRKRLRTAAAPSLPAIFNQAADGVPIAEGSGVCGTAAFRGEPVVVRDTFCDPNCAPFLELARALDLRACWSFPFFSASGELLGTFAIYFDETRVPTETDHRLARAAAHLAGIAVQSQQHSKELRLLGAAVERLDDLVVIADAETSAIRFVNRAFEEKTGLRREDTLGRGVREIERERGAPLTGIARALTERELLRAEPWASERDGVPRWSELDAVPIADAAGRTTHWVAIERDVTDRRRAEDALRTSEEKFRAISRATNDALWDWDLATATVWWSEGFEALFGYDRRQLEPGLESWTSRIHPDDRDRVTARAEACVCEGRDQWVQEYRFRRSDGAYACVIDRASVIRDAEGRAVRAVGGITDVTERRRTEHVLREQAALLEAANDAIVLRGPDDRVTYWNHAAERMYGWSAAEALGRPYAELTRPRAEVLAQARSVLASAGVWVGELPHFDRHGREILVATRWTEIPGGSGAAHSILSIGTDVTERKKLEVQYLRAQRLESIGTLAGGIAHDLNNVLTPILMAVEALRLDPLSPGHAALVDTIEVSATRGADMVRQVLSFARGMDGRRVVVRPRELVADIERIARDVLLKSIVVRTRIASDVHSVSGDPTQLQQVLLNLVVNARDAMPRGGTLTIEAENVELDDAFVALHPAAQRGSYVEFRITDTGTGIAPEIRERLFEPFFTTKEVGKGTGLGLSTVLAIVKSHGGFVSVYSELGKGTTFQVHLPARHDAQPFEEGSDALELPRGRGETVLVVDDEPSILSITKRTLDAFGYRVITAVDGAEAVATFAQRRKEIDVVLTDMSMPIMDGPATIRALRRVDPHVRIVAASGLDASDRIAKVPGSSVSHFLPKPYTASAMLLVLRRALSDS